MSFNVFIFSDFYMHNWQFDTIFRRISTRRRILESVLNVATLSSFCESVELQFSADAFLQGPIAFKNRGL